jgi:hypothetical protein
MQTGVVDEHGATGNAAQIPGHRRRQDRHRPDSGPHGYTASNGYMASSSDGSVAHPRLLVLVVADWPQGAIFDGVVAAPVLPRSRSSPAVPGRACLKK